MPHESHEQLSCNHPEDDAYQTQSWRPPMCIQGGVSVGLTPFMSCDAVAETSPVLITTQSNNSIANLSSGTLGKHRLILGRQLTDSRKCMRLTGPSTGPASQPSPCTQLHYLVVLCHPSSVNSFIFLFVSLAQRHSMIRCARRKSWGGYMEWAGNCQERSHLDHSLHRRLDLNQHHQDFWIQCIMMTRPRLKFYKGHHLLHSGCNLSARQEVQPISGNIH